MTILPLGTIYTAWIMLVRIIALGTIRNFWENAAYRDSEQPLKAWYAVARQADWKSPQDVKNQFGNASIVGDNRVVFNIAGNDTG